MKYPQREETKDIMVRGTSLLEYVHDRINSKRTKGDMVN
jgi:hypothetical protein